MLWWHSGNFWRNISVSLRMNSVNQLLLTDIKEYSLPVLDKRNLNILWVHEEELQWCQILHQFLPSNKDIILAAFNAAGAGNQFSWWMVDNIKSSSKSS